MRYYFKLFSHFFSAHSRHGTHSPFVYKLADEVIYRPSTTPKDSGLGVERLLRDIALYYAVDYVYHAVTTNSADAACIIQEKLDIDRLADLQKRFRYLVIKNIYSDQEANSLWKAVCQDSRFIVCIDLFYFGLIFFRREQPKEVFKLRYPFWR